MVTPSPTEEFSAALRALHAAAGTPTYGQLVHQAGRQQPPVNLTEQSLSDWLTGKSVPASTVVVRFLAVYLGARAQQRGEPVPGVDLERLHERARQARQASRGGRPRHESPASVPAAAVAPSSPGPGIPIRDCDPLALEVHPAITGSGVGGPTPPALPQYVARAHDARLRELAGEVLAGKSQLVTLVGGSSTGKTRACWELAQHIEEQQLGRWRLWHPYDPTRPEAAAHAIDQAGPHTIVWLNEAQHYLNPPDPRLGERIAAGLRTMLHDSGRRPVLVVATLWPQHWTTLITRPDPGQPDPFAQARDLLTAGEMITIPDGFTAAELAALGHPGVDERLRQAAAHAEGGRITQYLAGAPDLQDRYRNALPAARAIIQVATDARRLGHPVALPHALLEQAAHGYLDDHDWDALGDDWLEEALAYTARPCKGARGTLTRIRPRPGDDPYAIGIQPHYRLADYLEQVGRTDRAGIYPPDSLWTAFTTTIGDPDLLHTLGQQAEARGRYQHAIAVYTGAADRGHRHALWALASLAEKVGAPATVEALYLELADHGDNYALSVLAGHREEAGDIDGAKALAVLAADRGDTVAFKDLAERRRRTGDPIGAETLYQLAADRGDTEALMARGRLRERAGDTAGAETLYRRAAEQGSAPALAEVARLREQAGDAAGAEDVAALAVERGSTDALTTLAELRKQASDLVSAEALYRQAAELGSIPALAEVTRLREQAGDPAGAEDVAALAVERGSTDALSTLAWLRLEAGNTSGAEALYRRAADQGSVPALVAWARLRDRAGDVGGAEELYRRAADQGSIPARVEVVRLREQAGDAAGAEAMAARADWGGLNPYRGLAMQRDGAGDAAGAEALALRAAARGDTGVLVVLAQQRWRAGDTVGSETLYQKAADHGDVSALQHLARQREQAEDTAAAESLYQRAADRGGGAAPLYALASLRDQAGDSLNAACLRQFGLTGAGTPASGLDFGRFGRLRR